MLHLKNRLSSTILVISIGYCKQNKVYSIIAYLTTKRTLKIFGLRTGAQKTFSL